MGETNQAKTDNPKRAVTRIRYVIHDGFCASLARGSHCVPSGKTQRYALSHRVFNIITHDKMDADGKAAGLVELKAFNKKVCATADPSY